MTQTRLLLMSIVLILGLVSEIKGQVQVINSNNFYDLCCKFRNTTGYQIVLLPTNNSAEFNNLVNDLELGAIHDPTTCVPHTNPYSGMLFLQNPLLVKVITLLLGGNNEPIFVVN